MMMRKLSISLGLFSTIALSVVACDKDDDNGDDTTTGTETSTADTASDSTATNTGTGSTDTQTQSTGTDGTGSSGDPTGTDATGTEDQCDDPLGDLPGMEMMDDECPGSEEYLQCLQNACNPQFSECFGPNWASGIVEGTCGGFITCIDACDTCDDACLQGCFTTHTECTGCLVVNVQPCVENSGCVAPECDDDPIDPAACTHLAGCCPNIADANQKAACDQTAANGDVTLCSELLELQTNAGNCG